jgi:hypothetical protein
MDIQVSQQHLFMSLFYSAAGICGKFVKNQLAFSVWIFILVLYSVLVCLSPVPCCFCYYDPSIILFLSFKVFTFTYMCIHCLGHSRPPTILDRTCSALLFSEFVEENT